jgi:hypothetical protein
MRDPQFDEDEATDSKLLGSSARSALLVIVLEIFIASHDL